MGFFNQLARDNTTSEQGTRALVRALAPPAAVELYRAMVLKFARDPWLEYAPQGWDTALPETQHAGWDSPEAVDTERRKWSAFRATLDGSGPLAFSHEHTDLRAVNVSFHNINLTYAYVLGLAAEGKRAVSVLDYGGSLGHYYLLGKVLFPGLQIAFHCKEVPRTAALGRQLNPEVQWYSDDSCLDRAYDLVMLNGVLQYMPDWREALPRFRRAVGGYLFFGQLPLLNHEPGFVALQRHYGAAMLHEQFNREVLLREIDKVGLRRVREFVTGYRPIIRNAPEQCELRSWLFRADDQ